MAFPDTEIFPDDPEELKRFLREATDSRLGRRLWRVWVQERAEAAGLTYVAALPRVRKALQEWDTPNIAPRFIPVEKAVRLAARGEYAAAGRILRAYMEERVSGGIGALWADRFLARHVAGKRPGMMSGRARAKQAEDDTVRIKAIAKRLLRTHDKREIAGIISRETGFGETKVRGALRKWYPNLWPGKKKPR
jgi:hypothetical protein